MIPYFTCILYSLYSSINYCAELGIGTWSKSIMTAQRMLASIVLALAYASRCHHDHSYILDEKEGLYSMRSGILPCHRLWTMMLHQWWGVVELHEQWIVLSVNGWFWLFWLHLCKLQPLFILAWVSESTHSCPIAPVPTALVWILYGRRDKI